MIIILMGVSGSGKTAIGKELSKALKLPFYDADDFHSQENKAKMSKGIPLTDSDRKPWLETLATFLKEQGPLILGCSALKEFYRKVLMVSPDIKLIYLKGSYELIRKRLEARKGHFFDPSLLDNQFADLEEPKDALTINIQLPINEIISLIQNYLIS